MSDFNELLQKAEKLSAEFQICGQGLGPNSDVGDIYSDLPRVDRSLKQLIQAGQQLFSKTKKDHAGINLGSQDVKASVLLGSRGVDLPSMATKLDTLSSTVSGSDKHRAFIPIEPAKDTDVVGFLRNERENAILSVIAETRTDTFENAERIHWESAIRDWEAEKRRILNDLSGGVYRNDDPTYLSALDDLTIPIHQLSRVHDPKPDIQTRLNMIEKHYRDALVKNKEDLSGETSRSSLINEFVCCVSEIILESGDWELLIGRFLDDGTRKEGLIDKIAKDSVTNFPQKVIDVAARDSEKKGMFEDSIHLYDIGNHHEKVISLSTKLLAQVAPEPNVIESRRDRLQRQAVEIARRYRLFGTNASKEAAAGFFLLLDIMTFFDAFHSRLNDVAMDVISKIKIIPLIQNDVDMMVASFRLLPDEIRRIIPDILVATMTLLHSKYKSVKSESKLPTFSTDNHVNWKQNTINSVSNSDGGKESYLSNLRDQARALITYAGMIPYRMPGDINAKLMQLEVKMN